MNENAQTQIDEQQGAGSYRAKPLSWTIEKKDSGSVAIAIQFGIIQKWHPEGEGTWSQPWPPGYYTYNRTYVIKKDGNMNDGAVKGLADAGIWNGNWDLLAGDPPDVVVIIDVQRSEWQGNVSYRAEWINPNADRPVERGSGFKPVDTDLLAQLRQRFQSQTSAIVGGAPAGGSPPAPPQTQVAPPAPGIVGDPLATPTPPAPPGPPQGIDPLGIDTSASQAFLHGDGNASAGGLEDWTPTA
jgi:hypothetical protein